MTTYMYILSRMWGRGGLCFCTVLVMAVWMYLVACHLIIMGWQGAGIEQVKERLCMANRCG